MQNDSSRQRHTRSSAPSPLEALEARRLFAAGFHTAAPAYLTPTAPGVEVTPLLTTGDSVGGYRMVGVPDGLGAYDNGDGTFTVLMNHELRPARAPPAPTGAPARSSPSGSSTRPPATS